MSDALLEVNRLSVFRYGDPDHALLREVQLTVERGQRVGIVGESGAGKSTLARAILGLLPSELEHSGEVLLAGQPLDLTNPAARAKVLGKRLGFIVQNPMTAFNPLLKLEVQLRETLLAHQPELTATALEQRIMQALEETRVPEPRQRLNQYPHELSGGLLQRMVIACVLLNEPELIIADEPTTALDVTIQAEIVALLQRLCDEHQLALLLISHDFALISHLTDMTAVLYAGQQVEWGATHTLIRTPSHPYTQALLDSLPQRHLPGQPLPVIPGIMAAPGEVTSGCAFAPRCPRRQPRCQQHPPQPVPISQAHDAACFFPLEQRPQEQEPPA